MRPNSSIDPPPIRHVLKAPLEHHYLRVGEHVYTDIAFDYGYWREFLEVFDQVEPIARIKSMDRVPDGWIQADGPGVVFRPVHDYRGLWSFLMRLPGVTRDCFRWMSGPGHVLLHTGNISYCCWLKLKLTGRPYAMEIVGHAGESVTLVKNVQFLGLAKFLGWLMHRICRVTTGGAYCANYVSRYLQREYPTRSKREWVFSDVRLPLEDFAPPRPAEAFSHRPLRVVTVGRAEPEKAQDVLIKAVARLSDLGVSEVELDIAGDGSQMEPLRQLAQQLGIGPQVRLLGRVTPGKPLMDLLDSADLFVLPSLTEGLGRALLEGMSRGLPAVGSRVGGILELLEGPELVPAGDVEALAQCLAKRLADPQWLAALSRRNVDAAKDYRLDVLKDRKLSFWKCILQMPQ